jgi:two-component system, OmpR family, sensor histidine kinase KdpD
VLQPRRATTSLSELVDRVLGDLAPALHRHPVRLDLPDALPPVDADVTLISRVLTNLLENAIRHAPKGTPITVGAAPRPPDAVAVFVADQGPGVDPEHRDEIFGLLARRTSDAGAGLGLSIAKTFIEAHGQRIWVDDAPDGGARFWFTLPTAQLIPEEPPRGAGARH